MEKSFRGKRASEAQKKYLINYLELHTDTVNDRYVTADGAQRKGQNWQALAQKLNALGGTYKDGTKWKKYWNDLRLNTRLKYNEFQLQGKRVNGIKKLKDLTAIEKKIIQLTATEKSQADATANVELILDNDKLIATEEIKVEPLSPVAAGEFTDAAELFTPELHTASNATSTDSVTTTRNRRRATKPDEAMAKLLDLKQQKLVLLKEQTQALHLANDLKKRKIELCKEQNDSIARQTKAIEKQTAALEAVIRLFC